MKKNVLQGIYVNDLYNEIGKGKVGAISPNAAIITEDDVMGTYMIIDPWDINVHPATKADFVEYNKAKEAKYTPYAAIKMAVKEIVETGWSIRLVLDTLQDPDLKEDAFRQLSAWKKILQWAGFMTKEEFVAPFRVPSFAYKFEKKWQRHCRRLDELLG